MTMLTWSTMANSQQRIDKNDSNTIARQKWKCQCKIIISITYRHFQMNEVDIEGVKIQFKSMTNHSQKPEELMYCDLISQVF